MNSQDQVTANPPKHSCTAEIIAELERVLEGIKQERANKGEIGYIEYSVDARIKKLKAKEAK